MATGGTRNPVEMACEAMKITIHIQAPGCVGIIEKLWGLMGNHAVRSWLASGQGAEKQDIPGENNDSQEFG